jgi:hypothetical protein
MQVRRWSSRNETPARRSRSRIGATCFHYRSGGVGHSQKRAPHQRCRGQYCRNSVIRRQLLDHRSPRILLFSAGCLCGLSPRLHLRGTGRCFAGALPKREPGSQGALLQAQFDPSGPGGLRPLRVKQLVDLTLAPTRFVSGVTLLRCRCTNFKTAESRYLLAFDGWDNDPTAGVMTPQRK